VYIEGERMMGFKICGAVVERGMEAWPNEEYNTLTNEE